MFKWAVPTTLIVVLAVGIYFYRQVDLLLCAQVEEILQDKFPHLRVSVGSAKLLGGRGIELRNVAVRDPRAPERFADLVQIDEIFLACSATLEQLATGPPKIERIDIRRPRLRLARDRESGRWNLATLFPLPERDQEAAPVNVYSGTVEVFHAAHDAAPLTGVLLIDSLHVGLEEKAADQTIVRRFQASLRSDFVDRLAVKGIVATQTDTPRWAISGTAEGLAVSSELAGTLASLTGADWPMETQFDASLEIPSFLLESDAAAPLGFRIRAEGSLSEGRVADARFPHRLKDIEAQFSLGGGGAVVTDLTGDLSGATLRIPEFRYQPEAAQPLIVFASLDRLELTRSARACLPDPLCKIWDEYHPEGIVSIRDARFHHDGRKWHADRATIVAHRVAATYEKFPYPAKNITGSVAYADDICTINLTTDTGNGVAHVFGKVHNPGDYWTGEINFTSEQMRVHDALIDAMPDDVRRMIRDFRPRGEFGLEQYRIWKDTPDGITHRDMTAVVQDATVEYRQFPYPVTGIRGIIRRTDEVFTFEQFVGKNDSARVEASGSLQPSDGGHLFTLVVDRATKVRLDAELRDALPSESIRQLWRNLDVEGFVDIDFLELTYDTGTRRFGLEFDATPHGDTASIEPVHFPYRLENLAGTIEYEDGSVTVRQFSGRNGNTSVRSVVTCNFEKNGSWVLGLSNLNVDQLELDRSSLSAMPERLRRALRPLAVEGPVNIRGQILLGSTQPSSSSPPRPWESSAGAPPGGQSVPTPVTASWGLDINFQQAAATIGVPVYGLSGAVSLEGSFNGVDVDCRGTVSVDSAIYEGIQFRGIRGPIRMDNETIRFGKAVFRDKITPTATLSDTGGPSDADRSRALVAELFGGTLLASGVVQFDEQQVPHYYFTVELSGAELRQAARELGAGVNDLTGRIGVVATLHGQGRSLEGLQGQGQFLLRDGDIYELPQMMRLLKVLKTGPPDDSAFSEADIRFFIQGEHIALNPIKFYGDTFSLEGNGSLDFDREIDCVFRAYLGGQGTEMPLLRELRDVFGQASGQLVLIWAKGKLPNPQIYQVPLPAVNQALRQLQLGYTATGPSSYLPPPPKKDEERPGLFQGGLLRRGLFGGRMVR